MKTVSQLECWTFISRCPDSRHALALGLLSRRVPEGLWTAAQRGKNSWQKQHLSMVGAAWELDRWKIKTQYVREYPRKWRHSQLSLDRSTQQLLAILLLGLDAALSLSLLCCSMVLHTKAWLSIHKQCKLSVTERKEIPALNYIEYFKG